MNKKIFFKSLISLGITFALACVMLVLTQTKTYQILEYKALDVRFVLKKDRPAQAPVVHIDIDDESLSRLGRWPWPRTYHAALVDILKECQARQVLFDVLFMEPMKDSPQDDSAFAGAMAGSQMTYLPFYFVEKQSGFSVGLEALLRKDISIPVEAAAQKLRVDATMLKDQMSQAKRYIINEAVKEVMQAQPGISFEGLLDKIEDSKGWRLFPEDENYISDNYESYLRNRFFISRFAFPYPVARWPFEKTSASLSVPIMVYLENIKGSGFINADPDLDGVTRRIPLFIRYEDTLLPQLTIAALLDLLEVKGLEAAGSHVILKQARINNSLKDIVIPVDEKGRMLVNWRGRWGASFKHIPYYRVLSLQEIRDQLKTHPPEKASAVEYLEKSRDALKAKLTSMVKDKICIVGLTATGTHDLRPVPLQANYPMVGTHSNTINTILTGNFIVAKKGLPRALIFFLTALIVGCGAFFKLWKSLLLSLCYALGYFFIALWVFNQFGWWIDLVGPLGIIIFGFSSVTSFRYFTEEREKAWIKRAFSHYVSKEVISELMNDPSKLKLGGERRTITVIFSDVRGFTSFSEAHQPEEVVAMLNMILTEQVKVVFKYGGTLDKFVGDELMAFFGAPGNLHLKDHAMVAVRTAVEIQARMRALQAVWAGEKKESLQIGIGINTGEMVVGNMGSAERMDYTVIGDNVNLGARLCAAASKDEIIISQKTYECIKDQVDVEKLEPILVKGKANPIAIYRVTGLK